MIDKSAILIKSLYFESELSKDFEKYKDLVWEDHSVKNIVEYYKDNIYKQITTHKGDNASTLIRYFIDFNKEKQKLTLHRLDGPAYDSKKKTKAYYINGTSYTEGEYWITIKKFKKFKPEDVSTAVDLLNV